MIRKDLFNDFDSLAEEKGLDRELIIESFVEALEVGCKREHGVKSCRVVLREERSEILLYKQYLVVEDFSLTADPEYSMILLKEAQVKKPRIKVGDIYEEEVNPTEFGNFAVRDFKNKFNELLVNYQKDSIFDYFNDLAGKIITARVIDAEPNFYRLDIGRDMSTILPVKESLPKDNLHKDQLVKILVTQVEKTSRNNRKNKWPKVFVSRTDKNFIIELMKTYIPEIEDGIIEIVGISRDPGDRTKVGVRSNDDNIDPVGACIGEGGSRIRDVLKEIGEEKIDIFRWIDNERDLITESLKPATVLAVTGVNPIEKQAYAIVPDDQLSLAIGKKGQNVKLAVEATGWSIDIKSEAMAQEEGILY